MNEDCLFFPELYRLVDREKESQTAAPDQELKGLVDLCTLCGLCPCPNIRNDVIRAKAARVRENGMSIGNRLLADVQQFGRTCGRLPGLVNGVVSTGLAKRVVKRVAGIHPKRKLPCIPKKNFFAWAKDRGLCRTSAKGHGVAYFAGCTASYLFPEVGRAAVMTLEKNEVQVFVPPQQCCGMPTLVEGDLRATLNRSRSNLDSIRTAKDMGFEPVSSCPTCGFLMKVLLKEGAYHSESYQRLIGAGDDEIKLPKDRSSGQFTILKKTLYATILKDDGLLSELNPLDRIDVADSFCDVGEYLARLLSEGKLDTRFRTVAKRIIYFAPCHQREQKIGSPYVRLLRLIPGLDVEMVGGPMDCCGMGGSLGYKKGFYEGSISLGASIAAKIRNHQPDVVVTDCLSCRLQFQHLLPFPVSHPLELLSNAYGQGTGRQGQRASRRNPS